MHKKTTGVIHKILHFFEGAVAILTPSIPTCTIF